MGVLSELFAARHDEALARADVLAEGGVPEPAPHVELTTVTPYDVEELGRIAARAVRFGSGDLELAEVDLEHETLFRLPRFLCEVLVELGRAEDPDALPDVAAAWAASEEMEADGQDLSHVVRALVDLATQADSEGDDVWMWVAEV